MSAHADCFTVAILKGAVEGDTAKHFAALGGFCGHWDTARELGLVEYRLTFDKCEPRDFGQDSLSGPDLPNAYDPEGTIAQPGEWYGGNMLEADAPDEEWLSFFAGMCIAEAVHEALEWFKVDGRPWLNPRGWPARRRTGEPQ